MHIEHVLLCTERFYAACAVAVGFFGVPAASIPQEMLPPVGEEGDPAGRFGQQLSGIVVVCLIWLLIPLFARSLYSIGRYHVFAF